MASDSMDHVRPVSMKPSETIEEFISYFERIAIANEWNDEKAAKIFPALLISNSKPLQIFESLSDVDKKSFNRIKVALEDDNKSTRNIHLLDLLNVKRGKDESLTLLAARITKLVNQSYPSFAKTNKAQLVRDFFLNAVNIQLKVKLLAVPGLSNKIDEVLNIAVAIDSSYKLDQKTQQQYKNVQKLRCEQCHRTNHKTEDCYAKKKIIKKPTDTSNSKSTYKTRILKSGLKRSFLVNIEIGEKIYLALIDTGSEISILPQSLVENTMINKNDTNMVQSLTNHLVTTIGTTTLKFKIGECEFEWKFTVTPLELIIIGYDFLDTDEYDFWTDFKKTFKVSNSICSSTVNIVRMNNDHRSLTHLQESTCCCISSSDLVDQDNCTNMTPDKPEIRKLLHDHRFLFNGLGKTELIEHNIILKEKSNPLVVKQHRIPAALENDIGKAINKLIQENIIEESYSDSRNPMVPIRKSDGSIRIAIDFRELNKITKKDNFPIPRIDRIITDLRDAKIFSKIDLTQGYYQISLAKNDREKTAFQWRDQLYHFKCMPFGLVSAPATFLRLMQKIFGKISFVRYYFDDILIFSDSYDQHFKDLQQVFKVLKKHNLTINEKKSQFFLEEIEFLGFKISSGIVSPSEKKIESIINFPTPKNKKEIDSFVGLCGYYRRLIPEFAEIVRPLDKTRQKKSTFDWNNDCEKSFKQLKEIMSSNPIIRIPNYDKQFIVRCDASGSGIGAVLAQIDDNNQEYVVEYASKRFSDCEMKYATIEKEATALMWSIQHWSFYLLGKKFLLETDHRPLQWLQSRTEGKLGRMALRLQEYEFDIKHIPGKSNLVADALSRIYMIQATNWTNEQIADKELMAMVEKNPHQFKQKSNLWYKVDDENGHLQLLLPMKVLNNVVTSYHNELNHVGTNKLWKFCRKRFYNPRLRNVIKSIVNRCCTCQNNKDYDPTEKIKHSKVDYSTLESNSSWAIDVCDLGKTQSGNTSLIAIIDLASKWVEACACRKVTTSKVKKFLSSTWSRNGKPTSILSDRGSVFESSEFVEFCTNENVEHHFAVAYKHETNGSIERFFRTIRNMIRTNNATTCWDKRLKEILRIYNNQEHSSTGKTPAQLFHGVEQLFEFEKTIPIDPELFYTNSIKARVWREEAKKKLSSIAETHKNKEINIGTLVLVRRKNNKNLSWIGPFKIVEKVGSVVYKLIGKKKKPFTAHYNQLKQIERDNMTLAEEPKRGRPWGPTA